MLNRVKLWALVSAVLAGGALFQLGCGNLFGGNAKWIIAWLNEDLFS